ncbi:hypothetical protein H2508_01385 [Parahaliea sp. F7430]|uniref:Uncharacterized protein n=1 Tax=Sediminihaliea albiluteola TaxID=2758564 RepID=A0A7W2TTQ4_9GAMM|nr:hypothetical protein [Sediminihaliea albiluteola]MBA6411761.1 hypothetical protein [Sediminihaliea albiluteola]
MADDSSRLEKGGVDLEPLPPIDLDTPPQLDLTLPLDPDTQEEAEA